MADIRTKRVGTDLYDTITLKDKDSGIAIDMSAAYDMQLFVKEEGASAKRIQTFSLVNNVVNYQYNSKENDTTGFFGLHLFWKKENSNSELGYDQYVFDKSKAFKIVPSSEQENWSGTSIEGIVMQVGSNGASAYEDAEARLHRNSGGMARKPSPTFYGSDCYRDSQSPKTCP